VKQLVVHWAPQTLAVGTVGKVVGIVVVGGSVVDVESRAEVMVGTGVADEMGGSEVTEITEEGTGAGAEVAADESIGAETEVTTEVSMGTRDDVTAEVSMGARDEVTAELSTGSLGVWLSIWR